MICGHSVDTCPEDCDGVEARWTPIVGKMFLTHGPGMRFIPDGLGGGHFVRMKMVRRNGFRPTMKEVMVPVNVHRA